MSVNSVESKSVCGRSGERSEGAVRDEIGERVYNVVGGSLLVRMEFLEIRVEEEDAIEPVLTC